MEQRSSEWFKARKGKLTGSNVGAALNLNPWKTPEDLIRQMVREYHGAEPEFTGNVATEYGAKHEPLAAMEYLGSTGNHVEECGFFVHPEHEWLGASPDGLIGDDGLIEIKCPFGLRDKKGKELQFKTAEEQPHYYAQMQIEMACTGREWCDFYQWAKHGNQCERIHFSRQWWEENLPRLEAFYDWFLKELENPEHLEPKVHDMSIPRARDLLREYDGLSESIKNAEARKKEVMAEIVKLCRERNSEMYGRKLTLVERKGNVDYSKVPELKDVDLEPYRRKPSTFWKLS